MKLLLITASSPEIRKIRRSRFLNFQQITMPCLAALTPAHWQVEHIDEEVRPVDFNTQADLVGITFHTPSAPHAYEIAEKFRLRHIIERIHAHGIAVQAGIVFGFDSDTRSIFNESVDFLEQAGVQNATFNILTPYPGTRLFQRIEAEGRILTYDWSKYNSRADVVFRPKQMNSEELLAGFQSAVQRFYSPGSIYKRLSRSPVGLGWTLPLNLAYHLSLRRYGLGRS